MYDFVDLNPKEGFVIRIINLNSGKGVWKSVYG
jgi:hypothetical protein